MHIDSYGNLFMNLKHKKRVQFRHLIFRFLLCQFYGFDVTTLNWMKIDIFWHFPVQFDILHVIQFLHVIKWKFHLFFVLIVILIHLSSSS